MSDKKHGLDEDLDGDYEYYTADVVNANDYYPFGMMMPGRKYSADDSYRFGFNGKENDNEVKGDGTQYDYGFRVYDPRIGKFLSVDPLRSQYPWYTPYQFAGNTPIQAIDIDGLEPLYISYVNGIKTQSPKITKPSEWYVMQHIFGTGFWYNTKFIIDPTTFSSAAKYNSSQINYQLYTSFGDKERYYKWAQSEMDRMEIKSKWFAMDAVIVGPYEVGLTELDPGVILRPETQDFLNKIGSLVLKENMKVYNQLSESKSFNGKTSGTELDRELLYNEQAKIQDYMYSLDISDLGEHIRRYNRGFKIFQNIRGSDHYLNVASSIIAGEIDFSSIKHRLIIGQVLMHQMHGIEINDEIKKQIKDNATEDSDLNL